MIREELADRGDDVGFVSFKGHLFIRGQIEGDDLIGRDVAELAVKLGELFAVGGILVGDEENLVGGKCQGGAECGDDGAQYGGGKKHRTRRGRWVTGGF